MDCTPVSKGSRTGDLLHRSCSIELALVDAATAINIDDIAFVRRCFDMLSQCSYKSGKQTSIKGAASAGASALVLEVDAANTDDVVLVRRVVERAVQRPVVADGRYHDDAVAGDLPHLQSGH